MWWTQTQLSVAHHTGGQGVAGSNPVIPTVFSRVRGSFAQAGRPSSTARRRRTVRRRQPGSGHAWTPPSALIDRLRGVPPPAAISWSTTSSPFPAPSSALAEADAEPAAWVAPGQRTRSRHRQARPAFQTCRVVHQDQPVLLAVDPGRADRDDRCPAPGGAAQLLVDDDVGFVLIHPEAVHRQSFRNGRRLHSARTPAHPSLINCLKVSGDLLSA